MNHNTHGLVLSVHVQCTLLVRHQDLVVLGFKVLVRRFEQLYAVQELHCLQRV